MEKFQITNPSKFGSPVSGISALAIMKKLTNGCNFVNMHCTEKFQITDPPPKVWVWFSKFSIVSVFPAVSGSVSTLKCGHAQNIYAR